MQTGLWQREFHHQGLYPEPWTTMQFVAAYDEQRKTGLYVAAPARPQCQRQGHLGGQQPERTVIFTFDHPAEDMGVAGNDFALSGEAIWQLLRGDWFDAALIYRSWLRRELAGS